MAALVFAGASIGFFTFLAVGILTHLFKGKMQIERRVASLLTGEAQPAEQKSEDSELSFQERVIRPIWQKLRQRVSASMPRGSVERLEKKLLDAGNPFGFSAVDYRLVQGILSFVLAGCFLILFLAEGIGKGIAAGILAGGFGLFYTHLFLIDKKKQRVAAIDKVMPDFFDMVTISLEAGMGVDAAISKVCRQMEGPLSQEFHYAQEQMKLGKSRKEAFSELRERIPSELFQSVITALIQADQFGIGMAKVLRAQTRRIREQRRQAAREKAMKAPVKMLIPMVLFIFPVLFVVILGPLIVKAVTQWF